VVRSDFIAVGYAMSANARLSGCQVRLRVINVKLGQARIDQAR